VPLLEQVLEKYPQNVKLVFKNFPLRNHKFAQPAAVAALAAGKQGKFWEFHDLLFKNYNRLNTQKIQQIAQQLNLDMARYAKDQNDPQIRMLIQRDISDAAEASVFSTPTVFINGRILKNRTISGFQRMIERELEKDKVKTN